jgi:hypothetical protein
MNQRKGKTHKAGLGDRDSLTTNQLIAMFDQAAIELKLLGKGDEQFICEQFSDYFRNYYSPSKGLDSVTRILGL